MLIIGPQTILISRRQCFIALNACLILGFGFLTLLSWATARSALRRTCLSSIVLPLVVRRALLTRLFAMSVPFFCFDRPKASRSLPVTRDDGQGY
jgi:hypothetical protein